jgi:peptidoglycan/xylan/chitin deacetylase (PgdA/CDA1 family)
VILAKIGSILYNGAIFYFKNTEQKKLYLTFDDGPTEYLTSWILETLRGYKAKGTFFCIGKNAERYPDQYQQIINEGHIVGNHTYYHSEGWRKKNQKYFQDIKKAQKLLNSNYFRPPHGKMKVSQFNHLRQSYNIILWDVLAKDYKKKFTPERIFQRVIRKARPGSILVFHDSLQAEMNLRRVLPRILEYYYNQGYEFPLISS